MAKKISVCRAEPILLEFEDGTTKKIMLNNMALIILTNEFGDISKLLEKSESNPIEVLSKLIYAGIKNNDPKFTLEEAEIIALNSGLDILPIMADHIMEVFDMNCKDEEFKKKFIKETIAKMKQ